VAEIGQVCVQVIFLYKTVYMDFEVMIQRYKICLFFTIILFFAILLNVVFWAFNSLDPREYYVDVDRPGEWATFDAIVGPLNTFFRFNSALVFGSTLLNFPVSLLLQMSRHLASSQDDLSESHGPQEPDHRTASDITAEVQVHDVDDLSLPLLSASLANSGGSYGTMNEDAV